jgi:hypothetical protein
LALMASDAHRATGRLFVERFPEAERAITDGNFWSALQSAPLHFDEQLLDRQCLPRGANPNPT